MNMLNTYIKKLYQFLKTHKSKWLVLIVFSLIFFLILFPYESAVLYLTNQLNKQTKSSVQLQYDSFFINPLGPRLVFKNPKIFMTGYQNAFTAKKLTLKPSYKSLLQLKIGGHIILQWSKGSSLSLTVRKTQIKRKKLGWLFHINAQNFNPFFLSAFFPIMSKMSGKINISIEAILDPLFETQPKGSWSIRGQNIQSRFSSYTIPNNPTFGTIMFPYFKWSRIHSHGEIKNGEFIISDFSLGENKDTSQIRTRGIFRIDFKKHISSKRIRTQLRQYNIGLDMSLSEDMKNQFYPSLDLLLSKIGAKTPQGWRYLGLIKGTSVSMPSPSPVSKLPTLQEIQNPKEPELENF